MKEENRLYSLARDVVQLSRNILILNLRFLDLAISKLKLTPYNGTLATDGECLYYDPYYILLKYKQEQKIPTHHYLHIIMHCIFHHAFIDRVIDQTLWDLACDIAVEHIILDMRLPCVETQKDAEKYKYIKVLSREVKHLTAEKIYRYYCEKKLSDEEMNTLKMLFSVDDHTGWYDTKDEEWDEGENGQEERNERGIGEYDTEGVIEDSKEQIEYQKRQEWKKISEQIQMDLDTISKQYGKGAGALIQNLVAVNREKYDYAEFLKRFSVLGEVMGVSEDEFDYIYYTYGLNLYKKMPLVEPLEYKEAKRIKEFVIAIDTSGSVQGKQVQSFITKTYNILKQQETFFTKINLHIIQCDTEIQQAIKITSQEEFNFYIQHMTLKGFGGTDFRPTFAYVNRLIQAGEFRDLKGLIYFTDGYGIFPKQQPDYTTAFVFVNDEYDEPEVPVWAIKLVLQTEEL